MFILPHSISYSYFLNQTTSHLIQRVSHLSQATVREVSIHMLGSCDGSTPKFMDWRELLNQIVNDCIPLSPAGPDVHCPINELLELYTQNVVQEVESLE